MDEYEKYHQYLLQRSFAGKVYRSFYLYPLLSLHLKGRTLDIGCGIGDFCRFRKDVIGVDINPINIQYCQMRGIKSYQIKTDGVLPFEDNSFDSIILDNVMEHIEDPSSLLKSVYRVLRPGGTLLLGVPGEKGYKSDDDHVIFYDEDLLQKTVESHSFVMDKYFYTPLFAKKYGKSIRQHCLYMLFLKPVPKIEEVDISVVIPMYNAEKTIERSLNSIKSQNFKFNEVIIVNDGSTDNSLAIAKAFANANPDLNIKLLNQRNSGVSASRNRGINESNAQYIAFLDADDEWLPNKTKRQVEVIKAFPNVGLIGTARNDELYPKFLIWNFGKLIKIPMRMSLIKNFFPTPTVIINREVVKAVGHFDEKMSHLEDQDYWSRIARHFDCFVVNESLVFTGDGKAHIGSHGLSQSLIKMELGELRCISKAIYRGFLPITQGIVVYLLSVVKFMRRLCFKYALVKK